MMKKLQIVRIDNDLVEKADLQIGNNIISRGAATGCSDEKIIKHALTINVSPNGDMTITPKQVTSCYIKCMGSTKWEQLKLGVATPLKPGDICSLLPDKCWFKILSISEKMENGNTLKRKLTESMNIEPLEKKLCPDKFINTVLIQDVTSENSSNVETLRCDPNTIKNTNDADISTSYKESSSENQSETSVPEEQSTLNKLDFNQNLQSAEENKPHELNTVVSTNSETEKKIELDCHAHSSEHNTTSSSVRSISVSTSNKQNNINISTAKDIRNRCAYGDKCYRKNTNHRARFSHSGDPDYDVPDNRPECPYGVRCYRKNLQHKNQFKHTAIKKWRPVRSLRNRSPHTTSRTGQSSAEESVDESEYEPSSFSDSSDDTKSDWDESKSDIEDSRTG